MGALRSSACSPRPTSSACSPPSRRSIPSDRSTGGRACASTSLPDSYDLVRAGALDGGEPGFADEGRDVLDGDRVHVVRGLVHVLLEERAVPVVGSKVERFLPGALALREPRRLNVRKIVEVEPGGREHPQIRVGALIMLDP